MGGRRSRCISSDWEPPAFKTRASPISMCRKRPFAIHARERPTARPAVCRIPCRILCLADAERNSRARRPVLTRRQRSALFSLPPREAELLRLLMGRFCLCGLQLGATIYSNVGRSCNRPSRSLSQRVFDSTRLIALARHLGPQGLATNGRCSIEHCRGCSPLRAGRGRPTRDGSYLAAPSASLGGEHDARARFRVRSGVVVT